MLLKLREAQTLAYRWLIKRNEAALFMGCGLGKTATCLLLISRLLIRQRTIGVLVVAPKRVCNLVWPLEVNKWDQLSWLRVANLRTKEGWEMLLARRAHIYVINYEQLPKLATKYFHNRRQKTWAFDTVILDELTNVKNHKSKRFRLVKKYIRKLDRRWGLTGTPTPNGLLGLFGQVRALDNGKRFGISYTSWREKYFKPIDYKQFIWKPKGPESKAEIYEKISDLALVLKSCDYLDIPDTTSYDIEVPLPTVARKHYAELAKELYLLLTQPKKKDEEVTAVNSAVLVNKLLQISSGAIYSDLDLETQKKTTIQIHEAKTKALVSLVKSLDEPVLIACNFRHEQERILKAVKGCVRFDSFRSEKAQADAERRWNAGKIRAIVSHPKSIGHGLNLQEGGRVVIWTTPTWDGELYDQMNARVARTGQERTTEIYHLLSPGTMDDAVMTSLENKASEQNLLQESLKKFQAIYENKSY